jgi:putative ATPase
MPKKHRVAARKAAAVPSLFRDIGPRAPLAARMRPRTLDEFVGQQHLLAPGKPLREDIERGTVSSMVFWGPPGSGKTTLGRLIAEYTDHEFVPFSAVTEGVQRVREVVDEAADRLQMGRGTILFVDEIHRFNKAQQDAFLPHVEAGTITLIGATTENPSFELIGALLSRLRVFVLEQLRPGEIEQIVRTALADTERGLSAMNLEVDQEAIAALAVESDGDARRALTIVEAAAMHVGARGHVTVEIVREAMQKRFALHDKGGEVHYNMLSALHKSLRGSDPDGALYWAARMIEGGEDPMVIFRRALAMAAEDIGLADPQALVHARAAAETYEQLGSPEGELALANTVIYLATAPKSNAAYVAYKAAVSVAKQAGSLTPPKTILNAPTKLMKQEGYGADYSYDHDAPDAFSGQNYWPDALGRQRFYDPPERGFEREIRRRLEYWAKLREERGE